MIGRADIEGLKSNVAKNHAWPQASSLLPARSLLRAPSLLERCSSVGDGNLSEGNSPYLRPDRSDPHLSERRAAHLRRQEGQGAKPAADYLYPTGCDPPLAIRAPARR